jgi:hypothetical protein
MDVAGFTGGREQFAQVPADAMVVSQDPLPGSVIGKTESVYLTFETGQLPRRPHRHSRRIRRRRAHRVSTIAADATVKVRRRSWVIDHAAPRIVHSSEG